MEGQKLSKGVLNDINKLKDLQYDELRNLYRDYLNEQEFSKATIDTAYSDTFYLWWNGIKEILWNIVTSSDFENEAKNSLLKLLTENSSGNPKVLFSSYLSSLIKFLLFLKSIGNGESTDGHVAKSISNRKWMGIYNRRTSRAGIKAVLCSIIEPGDNVLVPIYGRFGYLLKMSWKGRRDEGNSSTFSFLRIIT